MFSSRAACLTKVPLLCSIVHHLLWQKEWANRSWRCFMRMARRAAWGSFRGFLATFFLHLHPAISFTLQPPTLKKHSLSSDQHNLSPRTASSLAPALHCHFEIGLGGQPFASSAPLLDSRERETTRTSKAVVLFYFVERKVAAENEEVCLLR